MQDHYRLHVLEEIVHLVVVVLLELFPPLGLLEGGLLPLLDEHLGVHRLLLLQDPLLLGLRLERLVSLDVLGNLDGLARLRRAHLLVLAEKEKVISQIRKPDGGTISEEEILTLRTALRAP